MARGEFALIDEFVSAFDRAGGSVRLGPGDDCAVLAPSSDETCVTTDSVVEGVHFSRPYFSLADVGHKALAVNLSDLASMGARPSWFLVALAMPRPLSRSALRQLALGMASLARAHTCVLAGGNFTRASELSVTITAAGTVPKGSALLRSGARDGDLLCVSGTLGDAALALAANKKPRVDRQRRPAPRVRLGLLARKFASAAIDLSDGFVQDLAHVCAASRVRAEVDVRRLPLAANVEAAGERGLSWALSGGEDYELLLAIPPRRAVAFEAACAQAGEKVSRVGRFVRGRGIALQHAPSRLLAGLTGHDHFI